MGSIVEGRVTGITAYGAFVTLENNAKGLIHISEVSDEYVRDIKDYLNLDDKVRVKVISYNAENGRYELSLRQANPNASATRGKHSPGVSDPRFEEKLSKFLKASQEKLLDVKRNLEAKRSK